MRIWLITFCILFAATQLWEWIEHLRVPFPVYWVAGIALAIASNYRRVFPQGDRERDVKLPPIQGQQRSS